MHSAEEASRILKQRAAALARRPEEHDRDTGSMELLEFGLAHERYALETRHVQEVQPFRDLTPLPGTPPFLLGIVNLRGRILPVLDLKKFFELPERGLTDLHRIIVVRGQDMEFGLLADTIVGVRSIRTANLQASLPTLTGIRADYLLGVTEERLVVLAFDRILADPAILVDQDPGN